MTRVQRCMPPGSEVARPAAQAGPSPGPGRGVASERLSPAGNRLLPDAMP